MTADSHDKPASARKSEQKVLQRLMSEGQRPVAEALGVHESTISRLKSDGELERICQMMEVLGLKVVDERVHEWDQETLEAMAQLAREYLKMFSAEGRD